MGRDPKEAELSELRIGQNAQLGCSEVASNQAVDEERHEKAPQKREWLQDHHEVRVDLADFEANE